MYGLPRYLITYRSSDKKINQELWEGSIPAWMENDYYRSILIYTLLLSEEDFKDLTRGIPVRNDVRDKKGE